jgi:hypothetical protein
MRKIKPITVTLVGAMIVASLIFLPGIASPLLRQEDPRVYVTILGRTNGPDGVGLNTFAISNSSQFRVDRRACLIIFEGTNVPDDAVAGPHKILAPHETEVFDVEDPSGVRPRWRLKVACVAVEGEATCFLRDIARAARNIGMPLPGAQGPHEVYFLSDWNKP